MFRMGYGSKYRRQAGLKLLIVIGQSFDVLAAIGNDRRDALRRQFSRLIGQGMRP